MIGKQGRAADDATRTSSIDVSIVIPMLDEQDNVVPLYEELVEVMDAGTLAWEVIFVDDGSTDQTLSRLQAATAGDERVTIIELAKKFGQSAAMAAGIKQACGSAIVPMDADLQNDPRDIERLVRRLDEAPGYDIVSGWRKNRQDRLLSRRLPSVMANRLIARLTWTDLHDFGCSLKAYRREMLQDVSLFGEMHRFLPAICKWHGARVTEEVVNHRARTRGTSKYGLRRTIKVLLDLLTVKFLGDYLAKPLYFFGKLSMISMAISLVTLAVAIAQRFGYLYWGEGTLNLNRNVLVQFAMMLFLMSIMFIMIGVIAELLVRIYIEGAGKTPYRIRRVTTGAEEGPSSKARPSTVPASASEPR